MEKHRIVITGVGVVAPNGIGKDEFWANCRAGVSGIKPVTLFDTSKYSSHQAGEIDQFHPEEILGPKGLRNLDRTTKLALVASKLAIEDSNLEEVGSRDDQMGVVLGSTMGSIRSISEFDRESMQEGPRYVNPALFPNTVINSPASQIAIRFGFSGLNATISSGFTASSNAFGYAIQMLSLGRAKALLVGGAEELCHQTFLGFNKLRLLAENGRGDSGELQSDQRGTLLGEGAAMFVIESLECAERRSSKIYAELGPHVTTFHSRKVGGIGKTIDRFAEQVSSALSRFGVSTTAVESIFFEFSGSLGLLQRLESRFTSALLGQERVGINRHRIRSLIGETFSASDALQVAFALKRTQEPVVKSVRASTREIAVGFRGEARQVKKVVCSLIVNVSFTGNLTCIIIGFREDE